MSDDISAQWIVVHDLLLLSRAYGPSDATPLSHLTFGYLRPRAFPCPILASMNDGRIKRVLYSLTPVGEFSLCILSSLTRANLIVP